jgi:hypothetical protein
VTFQEWWVKQRFTSMTYPMCEATWKAAYAEGLKRAEEVARGQLAWLPVYPVNVIADAIARERTKREGE